MKLYKILLYLLLLLPSLLLAQIQLVLEVDSNTISMDEVIGVNVKVIGARNAPTPQINVGDNFNLQFQGNSSQINIINGNTTISSSFHYQLSPNKIGEYILGPARVEVDGNQYTSNTVKLQVTASSTIPNKERNYYIETQVDKKEAYLGEQILYTFKLYNKVQLYNSSLELPKFNGFISESLGEEKSVIKVINGVRWKETTLQYLLIPTKTGNLEIPPAVLDGKLVISQSFFGAETKPVRFQSDRLKIQIKELPQSGKPAGFSGLIGQFEILGTLEKNNIKQGESTTLTLEISGTGDAQDFPEPKVESDDFKVYDDKPTYTKSVENNQIRSKKVFKKAIVAHKAGTISIPSISISFFNPTSGKYESRSTQSYTINVTPSKQGEDLFKVTTSDSPLTEKKSIKLLATDLMPIFYNASTLNQNVINRFHLNHLYLINFIFFVLYLVLYFNKNFKDKLKLDSGKIRRNKAYNHFYKNYKKIKVNGDISKLSFILREYLGDKLLIDGNSITSADLDRIFSNSKTSPQSIDLMKKIFLKIDSNLFGGVILSQKDQTELFQSTLDLIKKMDKELS